MTITKELKSLRRDMALDREFAENVATDLSILIKETNMEKRDAEWIRTLQQHGVHAYVTGKGEIRFKHFVLGERRKP